MSAQPDSEYRPPAAWLYYLVTSVFWLVFTILMGVSIRRDRRLKKIKGPLIILGNHPSYLDPPIMAMAFFSRRIHFLTTDSFFRYPVSRWILERVAAIPKVQFRTDLQATKQMFRVIRNGGTLAIYPEGQRSLDGSLNPVDEAIAKLVKKTGCPVAIVRARGAYLSWPRWSRSGPRFGRIEVLARLLFTGEDLAGLSVAEIQDKIEQALHFNDYGWQRRRMRPFLSAAQARGLHNLCHQCPACGRLLAMQSSRTRLTCRYCGNQARLDRFGMFQPAQRDMNRSRRQKIKSDPHRWHQWQLQEIRKKMNENGFLLEFPAAVEFLHKDGTAVPAGRGLLRLTTDELVFAGEETGDENRPPLQLRLPYSKKTGLSFDFGLQFEIALGDQIYRFKPDQGQSVILFVDAILAAGGAGAS
jgi:1-acyl-sn-glycerol-3-phosphate acyltransferase